jgi:hypothetical protein
MLFIDLSLIYMLFKCILFVELSLNYELFISILFMYISYKKKDRKKK